MVKKAKQLIRNEKAFFWLLLFALIFTLSFYLFFINQTVINISKRSVAEKELATLSAEISTLEFQYINLKGEIDLEKAYALGFQSVSEPQFVTRRAVGQADLLTSVR